MAITSKKVLVTGGCGFIGSHVVERLAAAGNEVVVLDNLISGKVENISGIEGNVKHINMSVLDNFDELAKGAEVIFHLAANVFVTKSVEDPPYDANNNIMGTLNVLETARRLDIPNLVFSSSSSVYGDGVDIPTEEDQPKSPMSPYGVGKLVGELYCRIYADLYGINTVALRYFNVFGIRQSADSPYSGVIALFIRNAVSGKSLTVYGDGEQSRDFVGVADVVSANLTAASLKLSGEVINIGTGTGTTINQLADIIESFAGKSDREYKPARKGDIKISLANISKAEKVLNFKPTVTLEQGLKELYDDAIST
jgi:UDP-glucose 4-epimerase